MPIKKKIYTVEITEPDTWYRERIGEKFEGSLVAKDNGVIAFRVNKSPFFFINIFHCKVVSEKILITEY